MKTKKEIQLAVKFIQLSTEFELNQIAYIVSDNEINIYSPDRAQINFFAVVAGLHSINFGSYCTPKVINGEMKAVICIY